MPWLFSLLFWHIRMLKPPYIKSLLYITLSFVLSRIIYYCLGIYFFVNLHTIKHLPQVLDPSILKNHLLENILYLHIQPPLFNLFIGLILKLPPAYANVVSKSIYHGLGLILAVTIFLLMARLNISRRISTTLTILFVISPVSILYETCLFYDYPVATLLCLAALFLHSFLTHKRLRDGAVFFTLLALIVLTRSFFNIIWYILFVLMLLFLLPDNKKRVITIAFVPFLIIFLWYAKNLYVFGSFSSSTFFGMNFARITTNMLSEQEREKLIKDGKISKISSITAFSPLAKYKKYLPKIQKTNIAVLDQELKSHYAPNYNNIAYIYISKQYLKDAVNVVRFQPKTYLRSISRACFYYFLPTNAYFIFSFNRQYIKHWDRFYNIVFYGALLHFDQPPKELREDHIKQETLMMGLFLIIGLPFLLFYGIFLILRGLIQKRFNLPFTITLLFLVINIIYTTVLGILFELGENNRFRFVIEPFFLIILGLFINNTLGGLKKGRALIKFLHK